MDDVTMCLYGANVFLGYLAMLAAMTYSAELFCMICAGLSAGYACFHAFSSTKAPSSDPCCPQHEEGVSSSALLEKDEREEEARRAERTRSSGEPREREQREQREGEKAVKRRVVSKYGSATHHYASIDGSGHNNAGYHSGGVSPVEIDDEESAGSCCGATENQPERQRGGRML